MMGWPNNFPEAVAQFIISNAISSAIRRP